MSYMSGVLRSFENLVQHFGIPRSQFYRYLQLRHMLCTVFGSSTHPPKAADTLGEVITAFGKGHEASVYYSLLIQSLGDGASTSLKRLWEKDLNLVLEERVWAKINKRSQVCI